MKNISFITIHIGSNFGSNLQTIATAQIFKMLGFNSVVVNYIPPRVTYKRFWQRAFSSPLKFCRSIIVLPLFCINKHIYNSYLAKHCNVSKPIYAEDDFVSKCPKADYYVTGSDQVWNFKHNEGLDTHYFFDGIKGKKIAYASSIGMDKLSKEEQLSLKKYLKIYDAISVREASAKEQLQELEIEATHVLDPTLMLNKEQWSKYISKRIEKDKYILVYLPYNIIDENVIYKTIRNIAKQKQLKVVTFSWTYFTKRKADKTYRFCNPSDFLSLMYYADYVVTNSFHGTAFSINLNKQFWVYMPSKFSTRVKSLLDLCKINNRQLTDEIDTKNINEVIDYTDVNNILNNERQKAFDFLQNALK